MKIIGKMKKLILLLLFIPLVSFGQLSYKDIMKIDSKDTFKKYMFDKQFSSLGYEDGMTSYSLNPIEKDGETLSTHFAYYHDVVGFYFTIIRTGTNTNLYSGVVTDAGVIDNDYDTILRKVKRKCEFLKMYEVNNDNYACYECKDAEFEGYLGFSVINSKGVISQILPSSLAL
tara:strand:- start:743 stop:1261 length:519 start_codon:yes stop_codon:yes gene_type:complete